MGKTLPEELAESATPSERAGKGFLSGFASKIGSVRELGGIITPEARLADGIAASQAYRRILNGDGSDEDKKLVEVAQAHGAFTAEMKRTIASNFTPTPKVDPERMARLMDKLDEPNRLQREAVGLLRDIANDIKAIREAIVKE